MNREPRYPRTSAGVRLLAMIEDLMGGTQAPVYLTEALRDWIRARIVEVEDEADTRPPRGTRRIAPRELADLASAGLRDAAR